MARPQGARQILAAALAEPQVLRAVLRAVRDWLRQNREALLGGDRGAPPDMSRWHRQSVWEDLVERHVVPAVREVWTRRWEQRRALRQPDAWLVDHLRTVRSRLRAFSRQSFEVVRTALIDGVGRGESIPQLRDRIGRVLDIDAPSRGLMNRIMDLERRAADRRAAPEEREQARRAIRQLYRELDDADRQWQWRAERIARTETIGAFNAGAYAAAEAQQALDGDPLRLQWWATRDTRTRTTHRAAHGQVVPVGERFQVGRARLLFPGDPSVDAPEEVINCRCVAIAMDAA